MGLPPSVTTVQENLMGKTAIHNAVSVAAIAQEYGTPLYLYNLATIEERAAQLTSCLPSNFRLHYALKANSNLTISQLMAKQGAGSEVSSLGELVAALKSGFSASEAVFTGPGKTNFELASALDYGIGLVVVESVNEAKRLDLLAAERDKKQPVLLRINPQYRTINSCDCGGAGDDDLKPIPMNGKGASKFGVDEAIAGETLKAINELPHLDLQGIHIFTESNVLDYRHLLDAWRNTLAIANNLRAQGLPINILDFGGGIGVPYNTVDAAFDTAAFGQALTELFGGTSYHCILEMGRYIVCEAGSYITEVLDIKRSNGERFVIVNGGVHNIYRTPDIQRANRFVTVLGKETAEIEPTTLAGQLPTPLDIITDGAPLPVNLEIGDLVMIRNCGAYGYNHSLTNFALHPYPAEVAYRGGRVELVRSRGTYEDFFQRQKLIDF